MTYKEAYNYVKRNGITLFKITENLKCIPRGTKLYFGIYKNKCLSTWDKDTNNKNKQFNYNFDYRWSFYWQDQYTGSFELVEEDDIKPKNNDKLIIYCPKEEDYKRLVDEVGWRDGKKNYHLWAYYEENFAVRIEDGKIQYYHNYGNIEYYKDDEDYKNYTFLTADEYFNRNKTNNKFNNKIMKNIVNFAKDLILSKNEKLLRKHGLKDECGNYTESYNELRRLKANEAFETEAIEIVKKAEEEEKKTK